MAQGGLSESETRLLEAAIAQATKGFDDGGLPIGAVLAWGREMLAAGA